MIQGGDPKGNGTGGSDKTIKGEFASNGVQNNLSHTRGVISMARSNNPDSASSQFFIVHQDSEFLDGNYAAFGKVVDGDGCGSNKIAEVECTYNGESVNTKPVNRRFIKFGARYRGIIEKTGGRVPPVFPGCVDFLDYSAALCAGGNRRRPFGSQTALSGVDYE